MICTDLRGLLTDSCHLWDFSGVCPVWKGWACEVVVIKHREASSPLTAAELQIFHQMLQLRGIVCHVWGESCGGLTWHVVRLQDLKRTSLLAGLFLAAAPVCMHLVHRAAPHICVGLVIGSC